MGQCECRQELATRAMMETLMSARDLKVQLEAAELMRAVGATMQTENRVGDLKVQVRAAELASVLSVRNPFAVGLTSEEVFGWG